MPQLSRPGAPRLARRRRRDPAHALVQRDATNEPVAVAAALGPKSPPLAVKPVVQPEGKLPRNAVVAADLVNLLGDPAVECRPTAELLGVRNVLKLVPEHAVCPPSGQAAVNCDAMRRVGLARVAAVGVPNPGAAHLHGLVDTELPAGSVDVVAEPLVGRVEHKHRVPP